jgi:hypothetical protein
MNTLAVVVVVGLVLGVVAGLVLLGLGLCKVSARSDRLSRRPGWKEGEA